MRKAALSLFSIVLISMAVSVKAQDTLYLQTMRTDSLYAVAAYGGFYADTTDLLTADAIARQPFRTAADTVAFAEANKKSGTIWMKWHLVNNTAANRQPVFIFARSFFLSFYVKENDRFRFLKGAPPFFTPATKNERRSFRIDLAPGASATVLIRVHEQPLYLYRGYPLLAEASGWPQLVKNELFKRRYYVFVDVIFLSIIFFIAIHTLAQYFFNRRKEFLLYAFYATTVLVFFVFKFDEYSYVDLSFSHTPYLQKYANNILSYIMYYGYYRFVRSFIDFKSIAVWFYKVIRVTENLLLIAIVVDLALALMALWSSKYLVFNIVRCYLLVVGFTGVVLLFRSKNKLAYFIATGSGLLLAGGLAAMVLTWLVSGPYPGFDPIIYMQLGMVLELLFFTLGLSYKTSQIEKEKIRTQQLLIAQLEENKKLQDKLTEDLEVRLKEQTVEIKKTLEQLEKEKEQQLILEFRKKLAEMELQVLKSQLNPHFYFNTLNNLYGLTIMDPAKAPDAILKLSDIMEYVIYDCRSEKVPLEKELKFISSYFELEKLRYDDDSRIQLTILGDSSNKHISPLLLIQFIENSFKHGIEENKQDNYLRVTISIQDHHLSYSSINPSNGKPYNQNGVGLASVRKRLNMLYPGQYHLIIDDSGTDFFVDLKLQLS